MAPSVVGVCSRDGDWPTLHGKDPGAAQRRLYLGSGVVLTKSGLVVANAHICNGDMRVNVGGKIYSAEVLKKTGSSNLALLQVELPAGKHLQPATFAGNEDVQLGETILAVANPLGTGVTVTGGVISAMRGREGGRIQADADLGNSNGGSAIIDAAGRVVGIGDGGRVDPLDFAMLKDREVDRQPTNLKTFLGVRKVRQEFRGTIEEEAAADETIMTPVAATGADLEARASALQDMVKKTSGALLNIYVAKNSVVPDPDDPFPPDPVWVPMSLGSGVIIDKSGLAVSNWHVVDAGTNPDGSSNDKHRITARVFSGKEYEVKVLSISREDDLSLIQLVLDEGEEVPFVELGNSEDLGIGEAVAAIGNPHGRANTITAGVVSAKGQGIRVRGRFHKLKHLIETDAAINGGNSGGALLDMNGRLVGINSAGGGTLNNVGYAIAVDHVRRQITGLLLTAKKLRSPDLGMRLIDDEGKVLGHGRRRTRPGGVGRREVRGPHHVARGHGDHVEPGLCEDADAAGRRSGSGARHRARRPEAGAEGDAAVAGRMGARAAVRHPGARLRVRRGSRTRPQGLRRDAPRFHRRQDRRAAVDPFPGDPRRADLRAGSGQPGSAARGPAARRRADGSEERSHDADLDAVGRAAA